MIGTHASPISMTGRQILVGRWAQILSEIDSIVLSVGRFLLSCRTISVLIRNFYTYVSGPELTPTSETGVKTILIIDFFFFWNFSVLVLFALIEVTSCCIGLSLMMIMYHHLFCMILVCFKLVYCV